MTTAAIYARVSTQRQADEATIASQIDQLERYVQQHDYTIHPEHRFIDEAISGKHLQRPGLTRLRDVTLTGSISTILCLSPDRLSRNLGVQQFLLAEWQQLNIEVIFINRPRQPQNAHDSLLLNIEGAFAEYERTIINDRMRRGRRHRLRHGESMPYPAPYGYHFLPGTPQRGSRWEVDPAQALIVKQVFSWYTLEDLTITLIADRLNEQKTPASRGGPWSYSSVREMLHQPAYRGTALYGRHQRDYSGVGLPRRSGGGRLQYPRKKPRPADEWITIPVPALVDESIWQQAQDKRVMNAQRATRNSRRTYLLRSLLVCGICQSLLRGRTQGDRIYYTCPHGGKNRAPNIPRHTCSIRGDVVEPQVWQALAHLLDQPHLIRDAWEAHRQSQSQPASQVTRWQKRQEQLQKQRQRLLNAYQVDLLSLDELIQRQNPIDLELRELDTRLAAVDYATATDISLEHFSAQIERALQSTDLKTQQEVIQLLIERIIVTENELIIEHIVPVIDNSQLESAHRDAPSRQSQTPAHVPQLSQLLHILAHGGRGCHAFVRS